MTEQKIPTPQEIAQVVLQAQWSHERDLERQLYVLAVQQSAAYALEKMPTAKSVRQSRYPGVGRFELLEFAIGLTSVADGAFAEFGVYKGETLTFIADRVDSVVYGFDSFRGLPQDWFINVNKGHFDLGGINPNIATQQGNFRLVNGSFADTIPEFKNVVKAPFAFMNIDCDLYSSTKAIFDGLGDRIVSGTVIVFDEYFNYPGWQNHEFKAFQEFCAASGKQYAYKAYCPNWFSVVVQIV